MNDELSELRARYERLQLLYDVSNVIRSTLDPQEAMNLIVAQAVRVTGASSGSVVLVNPTTLLLEIHASHGLSSDASQLRLRVGEGITGWVTEFGKPARIGDVRTDPRYVQARDSVRSELAVPLEVRGEVHGVLNVDSDRENAFSESDQILLTELAAQATKVIHDTWLYAQLGLKARLFEALIKVSQTINTTLNLDEALDVITRQAAKLMEAKLCSLLLADPEKQWLDLRACYGGGPAYREKPRVSVNESLVGVVLRRAKALQVENVQSSSRYQQTDIAHREGLVSLLSVPLVYDHDAIGVLNIYRGDRYRFSNEEIRIVSALAELSAVAIRKARMYEKVLEAEEALRQNEKLSALGLLAAEVAHEIRNPLTVMKMLYHSLDLQFSDHDPRKKDAEIVREKMDHLNRIVEQILTFARNAEPNLESVDVNGVLTDLNILLRHKLSQQSVEAALDLVPALPPIEADKLQIEQVFLNLSLNAIQAMPKGGKLIIRTRAETDAALVEFEDNGNGMTEDEVRHAFDSFLQSKKPGGTGLGLAVVKRVLDAHHATLDIHSVPGRGTRITVRFPRVQL